MKSGANEKTVHLGESIDSFQGMLAWSALLDRSVLDRLEYLCVYGRVRLPVNIYIRVQRACKIGYDFRRNAPL